MNRLRSLPAGVRPWALGALIAAGIMTCFPLVSHGQASRTAVTATRPPNSLTIPRGTVAGYVFWDARRVAYSPSAACQGLQVGLSAINSTGIQSLGTTSQFQLLQPSRPGSSLYECSYTFQRVPEGEALMVQLNISAALAKQLAAKGPFPLGGTATLVKVPGGQCTSSPNGNPTSSTYLESGWVGCGENTYNVNFELVVANPLGAVRPQSSQSSMLLPQATGTSTAPKMLLQPNPQPGGPVQSNRMLVPAVGSAKVATPIASTSSPATSAIAQGKLKLGPPKSGPKVANPLAAQKSASILAQLDQQRKTDDKELSEIKPGIPAPTSGASANGVQTNASRMSAAQAPAPSTLLKPAGPGAIGTERTTASGTVSSAILRAPTPISNFTMTCSQDPTMRILNVSGSYYPATFTTIKAYDDYTITGCSFGNPGPNAKVYIYKTNPQGNGFPLKFQILEWHDNWIRLDLDWNLTGLFDQDNLTLVVQRADGLQANKGGFKFYAERREVLLPSIPRGDFSLWGLSTSSTSSWRATYNSPASDDWGFKGMTAEVQWYEALPFMKSNFDTANMPKAGRDVYDFSRLKPGFVPTAASLGYESNVCYAGTLFTSGNFNLTWQASQLWVDWQGQNCANGGDFAVPNSVYGLNVWVEGPRGLDPWTGLPTK